jgi:periplasmic copper chaperone A
MNPARRTPRRAALAVAVTVLVLLPAAPAAAHVSVDRVEPGDDGTSAVTFVFDHGCDGAPTDAVQVSMPDGVEALAAVAPDGWTVDVTADQVRWEGEPIEDGEVTELTVDVQMVGTAGRSFVFPAVQECTSGSYDWADTDPSGAYPAPTLVATSATLSAPPAQAAGPAAQPSVPMGPLVAALAVASVGAGIGGAWGAARHRRRT